MKWQRSQNIIEIAVAAKQQSTYYRYFENKIKEIFYLPISRNFKKLNFY